MTKIRGIGLLRGVVAPCLLALVATPAVARKAPPPPPEIPLAEQGLIDNVNGYTIDAHGALERFDGLLIDRTGHVVKLLHEGQARPERPDFRLNAGGRTMLPGLNDAHGHLSGLGFEALGLDLRGTTSLAQAQAALARYAAEHGTPSWIRGGGWNQEAWSLARFPTAADLDAAVKDRPVLLERVDGHALLANTAAMAAAGITAKTPDPKGGRIERDAKGNPTGLFVDAAKALIAKAAPPPLPRERETALAKAQEILLADGVTATSDMAETVEDWEALRRMGDGGRLRVRITAYADGIDALLTVAGSGPTAWLYDGHLRMVGVKLFADGALGSRGAWLKQPYADQPGTRGLQFLDDAKLRNLMSRAAMDDFQVAVHAIGDAANAQVLDAIDELSDTYKGDRRWRIEHAQIVDPADLPRFAKHGIVASMQPTHATSDHRMAAARLGTARLAGAYAWKTMLDEGVPLAFGSDYPVEDPNPFPGMADAVTREDAAGDPPGGFTPQQRITLTQALAAFTTGAAFAERAEDRIGSLAPGRLADFILLDRDPFMVDPRALRETKVMETWIGGVRAWVRK
ncbi:amidohydrolase [Sphingomonas nostoxanthinifaciens]|uniref:amidohydrolase n=1 Tax=Sphingomonas nostoxanthinifaciens TaxID=2872652 RepID=UPI001CC1EBBC|nr:amidohydrolase [Sphingomonas nostoxanthinifaciens]UAK24393.1 amidohydrolase [Sphingomonas nostoxanthinifaciens]